MIHDGINPSLDNYGQESGQAGRDRTTRSEAIILRKVYYKAGKQRPDPGWKTEAAMREFISGGTCCRVIIDRYMDSISDRTTCQKGEQFCDVYCRRGTKRIRVVAKDSSRTVC